MSCIHCIHTQNQLAHPLTICVPSGPLAPKTMQEKSACTPTHSGTTTLGMCEQRPLHFTETTKHRDTIRSLTLNIILVFASSMCGFWVVGSRNLLYWADEMNNWVGTDRILDVAYVVWESLILFVKIAIGGYGCCRLLEDKFGLGLKDIGIDQVSPDHA